MYVNKFLIITINCFYFSLKKSNRIRYGCFFQRLYTRKKTFLPTMFMSTDCTNSLNMLVESVISPYDRRRCSNN